MSKIEWCEQTWNPFVGCSICSAGCKLCYAQLQAFRNALMGQDQYSGVTQQVKGKPIFNGVINRSPNTVFYKPLKRKKPTVYFVNSMSDFWHENAESSWQAEALEIMESRPQHVFQILTKRPQNILPALDRIGKMLPPNVWLGASVEDGRSIDPNTRLPVTSRIDMLRDVAASIRFLSVEPLIGPLGQVDIAGIDWVIVGGESGSGARPLQADWVREVRDLCATQGVAFFMKQWGRVQNNPLVKDRPRGVSPMDYIKGVDPHGHGGALLDGVLHRDYPVYPKAA